MTEKQKNDVLYVCSLIETIARKTKNHRQDVIRHFTKADIERQLRLAEVNHCLSFEQVSDELIDDFNMLNQANGDRQILAKQLNISPHQLSYVTHSGEGEGLLFFGNVILPFVDHFPKDLELYRILTTKLNEISEGTQK